MRKAFLFTLGALLFFILPLRGMCQDLIEVKVKKFTCDGSAYKVTFGVANKYTYERNPTIAFRIERGGQIVACAQESIHLPAGADGSELREITIECPCDPQDPDQTLKIRYFMRRDIDRLGYWMSECP